MTGMTLSARGLGRSYGSGPEAFHALRDVNLDITPGESLAIVGKSGSGKTTLAHLLALLDRPSSGVLTVDGVDAATLSGRAVNALRNDRFGFVFQQFFLVPHLTVLENVALPMTIAAVGRRERIRRARHTLDLLGLGDKAGNRATDLSGGQKQRVCIARALVNAPDVIVADEPTGNLDSATGAVVEDLLFELHRDHGITLLVVTHDDDLAARCGRRVRLADGHLISDDRGAGHGTATPGTSERAA